MPTRAEKNHAAVVLRVYYENAAEGRKKKIRRSLGEKFCREGRGWVAIRWTHAVKYDWIRIWSGKTSGLEPDSFYVKPDLCSACGSSGKDRSGLECAECRSVGQASAQAVTPKRKPVIDVKTRREIQSHLRQADLPHEVGQLLSNCAPHCLVQPNDTRHKFQQEAVKMIEDALTHAPDAQAKWRRCSKQEEENDQEEKTKRRRIMSKRRRTRCSPCSGRQALRTC